MEKLKNFYTEYNIKKSEKKRFLKDAINNINAMNISQKEKDILIKDYKDAYRKYHVRFSEYNNYKYRELLDSERKKYISKADMQKIYRKYGDEDVRQIFRNKVKFLEKYNQFVNRRWFVVNDKIDVNVLDEFLKKNDCMCKELYGACGVGIKKIKAGTMTTEQIIKEYIGNNTNKEALIEECIIGNKDIQKFHPNSLNTIRVVTFSNKDKVIIMGALLRTGNDGSYVDNFHAGGIFAAINIESGIIESDGYDCDGNKYIEHPYSKVKFKGFQIPLWDNVKKMCTDACFVIPNIKFAGWDVAICDNNTIEFVEGNHAPDFDDGMQIPYHTGIKDKVYQTLKELKIKN